MSPLHRSGPGWASVTDKGGRDYQEDRLGVSPRFIPGADMFAIYDGHNGDSVAEFARVHMPRFMAEALVRQRHHRGRPDVAAAMQRAFNALDGAAADAGLKHDVGSTACVAVVTPRTVWLANAGDSRAIMRTAADVVELSMDHKPLVPGERARILQAGGKLTRDDGCVRINGKLNLSRSLGDRHMRSLGVVCTPDVSAWSRAQAQGRERYLVVASDGLWDTMSSSDVARVFDAHPQTRPGVAAALDEVVALARRRGSDDNISVLHVDLR